MNGKIGFVGNPIKLDKKSLMSAISKNKVPIVSPIGFDDNGIIDGLKIKLLGEDISKIIEKRLNLITRKKPNYFEIL